MDIFCGPKPLNPNNPKHIKVRISYAPFSKIEPEGKSPNPQGWGFAFKPAETGKREGK
jgi:hypothetical protein